MSSSQGEILKKMKNECVRPRSRSISSRQDRRSVHISKESFVGGWSGVERSASRTLSAYAYLQEVNYVLRDCMLSCGTHAFLEFKTLVDKLRSAKKNDNKIAMIERLVNLLEGYPLLILNLTIFLPEGYLIEIQRDAVIIKIYEPTESVNDVDTGHLRSIDKNPKSAWTWLGNSFANTEKALHRNIDLSPGRTRVKSTGGDSYPLISSKSNGKRPQSLSSAPSRRAFVDKQKLSTERDDKQVDCNDVYLLEKNSTSTDTKTLLYIREIKRLYVHCPEVYKRFLEIIRDMHSGTLEEISGISEIVVIFKNSPSLISGFNDFLPKGSRIVLPSDNDGCPGTRDIAPKYVLEHLDKKGQIVKKEIFL